MKQQGAFFTTLLAPKTRRTTLGVIACTSLVSVAAIVYRGSDNSQAVRFKAPAGTLPATLHVQVDGYDAAVLPNGRFVTPVGLELEVGAPKPFDLAVSSDGAGLATVNSGVGPFSATLIKGLNTPSPQTTLIPLNATFLGVIFSPDGSRFYVGGCENGNIWVGDTASAKIVGTVNLNTTDHPTGGMNIVNGPANYFKGAYPGRLALSSNGRYLHTTDQGGFQVYVVDTTKIVTGVDSQGNLQEPDNFAAVVGAVKAGRYPFGIPFSPDNQRLYVPNVGTFQYSSLRPASPIGNNNVDFPLCCPGAGYPDESKSSSRTSSAAKKTPAPCPAMWTCTIRMTTLGVLSTSTPAGRHGPRCASSRTMTRRWA
jgi:hypothetical protein